MATDQISAPSQEAIDSVTMLYNTIHAVFPEAVANFQSKWAAAHTVCHHSQATSARDNACIQTGEFDALKRLGPKILPLVVFKLATDDAGQNLWGVFLCEFSFSSLPLFY
jgi:hypothetical protein